MPRLTALMGAAALAALVSAGALAAAPEQPAATTMTQSIDASIRDAQQKRTQGDLAGAIRVLSQLMLVAADDPRVVGEYGKVLVQQGRGRDAVDFLARATQLQSGDWTLYSALGIACDQTGDFDRARAAYDQALSLKPGEAVVLNNYAMSRMLAGDLAMAKRLIAQAAAVSNDERVARNVKLVNAMPTPAVASAAPARPSPPAKGVPATTQPRPTGVAQQPPRPLTAPSVAAAASPRVVMQAVPVDPLAGKVGRPQAARTVAAAHKPPAKPGATATAKVVKPPVNAGIPALRLANDRQ